VTIMNVRQPQPLGLGNAILCAKPIVGDNPFVVVLPDVILDNQSADPLRYNLAAMLSRFAETGHSQVLCQTLPREELAEYSVITTERPLESAGDTCRIVDFIEKPTHVENLPETAQLAAVGRYVLSEKIWAYLEDTQPGAWGRIQLTDAIAALNQAEAVEASELHGISYNCGRKLGYMQAFVAYGLRNPQSGQAFRDSIKTLLNS